MSHPHISSSSSVSPMFSSYHSPKHPVSRSPSPTDSFFNSDSYESSDSPVPNHHSHFFRQENISISPLDLNDTESKTPLINTPIHSVDSPLIQSTTSVQTIPMTEQTELSQASNTNHSLDLLDCQDLVDLSRIMAKLEGRAELIDKLRLGLERAENSSSNIQIPSPLKSEINKRVMLAAIYQKLAKTIRKLGFNDYDIVVPPAVRDAAHFLNQGFRPVGLTGWEVGEFHYETPSGLWYPYHPRFSR